RFARPGWSQEHHELARRHVKVHATQRLHLDFTHLVHLRDAARGENDFTIDWGVRRGCGGTVDARFRGNAGGHGRLAPVVVARTGGDALGLRTIAANATAAPAMNSIASGATSRRTAAEPAIKLHTTGTTDAKTGTRGTAVRSTPRVNSVVGQGTANSGARG